MVSNDIRDIRDKIGGFPYSEEHNERDVQFLCVTLADYLQLSNFELLVSHFYLLSPHFLLSISAAQVMFRKNLDDLFSLP